MGTSPANLTLKYCASSLTFPEWQVTQSFRNVLSALAGIFALRARAWDCGAARLVIISTTHLLAQSTNMHVATSLIIVSTRWRDGAEYKEPFTHYGTAQPASL
jgi:hypothetical protein